MYPYPMHFFQINHDDIVVNTASLPLYVYLLWHQIIQGCELVFHIIEQVQDMLLLVVQTLNMLPLM